MRAHKRECECDCDCDCERKTGAPENEWRPAERGGETGAPKFPVNSVTFGRWVCFHSTTLIKMKITSLLSIAATVALLASIGTLFAAAGTYAAGSSFAILLVGLIAVHEYKPRSRTWETKSAMPSGLGSEHRRMPIRLSARQVAKLK